MRCPDWSADQPEHQNPAVEVYARAAQRSALQCCERRPPSRADIERWHLELFESVVPLAYYAGFSRQNNPSKPCLAQDVEVAGVRATPFDRVLFAFDELADGLRVQLAMVDLHWDSIDEAQRVRRLASVIGLAVGRFIRIHPFLNGNGRTSRLMWRALLWRFRLPPQCSVIKRPDEPYSKIMAAAMNGNYAPLTALVLSGIAGAPSPARKEP